MESQTPLAPLLVLFLVLLGVAVVLYVRKQKTRRDSALRKFSRSRGWSLDLRPTSLVETYPRTSLFHAGNSVRGMNLLTFTSEGLTAQSFDFVVHGHTQHGSGPEFFHVVAIEVPFSLPILELRPERALDRVVGAPEVEFESAEFNRAWYVTTRNERFAHDVVHPQMMEWLLEEPAPNLPFDVGGNKIYTYSTGEQHTERIDDMVWLLQEFRARIPDHVWHRASGR
ncbi:MAG: hypothetical protein ACTH2Q_14815 [Propionibacteriaceae bacterium]